MIIVVLILAVAVGVVALARKKGEATAKEISLWTEDGITEKPALSLDVHTLNPTEKFAEQIAHIEEPSEDLQVIGMLQKAEGEVDLSVIHPSVKTIASTVNPDQMTFPPVSTDLPPERLFTRYEQNLWYRHMCRALQELVANRFSDLIQSIWVSPTYRNAGYYPDSLDPHSITNWSTFEAKIRTNTVWNAQLDTMEGRGAGIRDWVNAFIAQQLRFPMGERLMPDSEVSQLFKSYGIEFSVETMRKGFD